VVLEMPAPESGTNWGRSRGQCLSISGVGEAGIPPVKVGSQFVVEDAGADLEEEVSSSWGPAHLLFFTMRVLMTWFTADSTKELEMVSPARWRSP